MKDSRQDSEGARSRGILHRSGLLTALILAVALGIIGLVWAAHMRGRIHQLTTTAVAPEPGPPARPGGLEPIRLDRMPRVGAIDPELTSAVLLPGLGLEVLQASLQLPGRSPVPLLLGSSDAELEKTPDAPVASSFSVLVDDPRGTHPLELVGGRAAREAKSDFLPDGSAVTAQFSGDVSDGKAAAVHTGIETKITTILSGRGLDLIVSAKNTGDSPRGIAVQWRPQFLAPRGGLQAMTLVPPPTQLASEDSENHAVAPKRAAIAVSGLDRTYGPLKHSYLAIGPELLLHNHADGYTLHLTALTPSIRSLQVKAAADGKSVLIAFSTAEGEGSSEARTMVAPGEILEWRVRVETTLDSTFTPAGN